MQGISIFGTVLGVIFAILFLVSLTGIRMIQEYQKAVIFRLGRCVGAKGPGLFYIIPFIDRCVVVDMRVTKILIEKQEVLTKDKVSAKIDAVEFLRVIKPEDSIIKVDNFLAAVHQLALSALRDVVGRHDLSDVLSDRDTINKEIQKHVEKMALEWGIEIKGIEIKDVEIPDNFKRAMAAKAEAKQEAEAREIKANAELTATKVLSEVAALIRDNPFILELRKLQAYEKIGTEQNTMIMVDLNNNSGSTGSGLTALAAALAEVRSKLASVQPPAPKTAGK
ncbi:MAG TPA: SPFH domain-containing protein [Patescibacteria group bacterium]|nr:SPFH domain-containing protein [Patescibacteria group bacterium]